MTHHRDINASHARQTPDAVNELLTIMTSAENPLSGILTEVLNTAMLLERQHHLRADRHECTDERYGYANERSHTEDSAWHHRTFRPTGSWKR